MGPTRPADRPAGGAFINGIGAGTRKRIPIENRSAKPSHQSRGLLYTTVKLIDRYYTPPPPSTLYPPEVHEYNEKFTTLLQNIKKRHDPTVTTVAQGVLEWKRKQPGGHIGQGIQQWLDRFYMSRIGIRFLIGQRESASD